MIYLIEEIWTDRSENSVSSAVGYKTIGYIKSKKDATFFVENGRTFTKSDCWAISRDMPQYRLKCINKVDIGGYKKDEQILNSFGQLPKSLH